MNARPTFTDSICRVAPHPLIIDDNMSTLVPKKAGCATFLGLG